MDAQRIAEIKKWLQDFRGKEMLPIVIQFGSAEKGQKEPPLIADLEELLNLAEAGLALRGPRESIVGIWEEGDLSHECRTAIRKVVDYFEKNGIEDWELMGIASRKLVLKQQEELRAISEALDGANVPQAISQSVRVQGVAQELRAIDMAFGNCLALDECRTRAEKVAKAMEMARKADELQRTTESVRTALDAAGAPHYNPMHETEGWGHARRIAWLHTEKGLADARLTALQKVWQEKVEALTERIRNTPPAPEPVFSAEATSRVEPGAEWTPLKPPADPDFDVQEQEESAGSFLQRVGMDGREWAREMHKRFPAIEEDALLGWCCNMIMAGYDEGGRRAAKNC